MTPGITVAIPSIPPRTLQLRRAVASVLDQILPASALSIALDHHREGAAATRQRALGGVRTEWVAFLDDDDEFLPQHLQRCLEHATETDADYVFPWFTIPQQPGWDPLNGFGHPFDPASPRQTTITTLVRTELAQSVGFLHPPEGDLVGGNVWGEDYQFTVGCVRAGAKIVPLHERTWLWHHHGHNTSGRPDRW